METLTPTTFKWILHDTMYGLFHDLGMRLYATIVPMDNGQYEMKIFRGIMFGHLTKPIIKVSSDLEALKQEGIESAELDYDRGESN
jgi:hypothetical protein